MGSGYLMRWANSMACAECDVCEVRARNISTRKLLVLRFRRGLYGAYSALSKRSPVES